MPKRQLPTGFKIIFRRLLKGGMPAKEAMAEAWKRYKTQSKRQAIRQSFENPKEKKLRFRDLNLGDAFEFRSVDQFPFSGMERGPWVKISARVYRTLEGDHRLAKHKLRVGSINAEVIKIDKNPIVDGTFTGIVSKNPRRRLRFVEKAASFVYKNYRVNWHSTQLRYFIEAPEGGFIASALTADEAKRIIDSLEKNPRKTKSLAGRKRKVRRNPIAIYNPTYKGIRRTRFRELGFKNVTRNCWKFVDLSTKETIGECYLTEKELLQDLDRFYRKRWGNNPRGGKILYGKILEIRGVKMKGFHRGRAFRHVFEHSVEAVGLSNGQVLLRSPHGFRLWDYENNI